ncbi:MAG: tRNA (adenosine(37)-N6)-dimethylallyltransferase MiaA [Candidatus Magasanikbacteria bacterium]|nr:tRNA (adenosine(37)-N6)-dimethylallyltransferase MiaA [Candidatus Magasanikbacteria bacterium]
MREIDKKLPKLVVILGPTASGKTLWSLRLAQKYGAHVISADSRQIYKKMTIGTGKEAGEWRAYAGGHDAYYAQGVPHFLMDIVDPGQSFTLAKFRDQAMKYAILIRQQGVRVLLVGGTGLYISTLVDNLHIPQVPPNKKLRRSLEEKSAPELWRLLSQLDPDATAFVDQHNVRRLIRALEVCILTGEPFSKLRRRGEPVFDVLQIGIDLPREILYKQINERVDRMMSQGLLAEVEALAHQRYGWELPSMSGIGYRQFREYFAGQISLDIVVERLQQDTRRYARRQLTWFRRDPRIKWCRSYEEADTLIDNFYLLSS